MNLDEAIKRAKEAASEQKRRERKTRFTLRFLLTKTPINGTNIKNWKNRAGS